MSARLLFPARAALFLGGCLTPEEEHDRRAVQNAVEAIDAAAAEMRAQADAIIAELFVETARNCGIPQATLTRSGERHVLALPSSAFSRMNEDPVRSRIACIRRWATEIGLTLDIAEARN